MVFCDIVLHRLPCPPSLALFDCSWVLQPHDSFYCLALSSLFMFSFFEYIFLLIFFLPCRRNRAVPRRLLSKQPAGRRQRQRRKWVSGLPCPLCLTHKAAKGRPFCQVAACVPSCRPHHPSPRPRSRPQRPSLKRFLRATWITHEIWTAVQDVDRKLVCVIGPSTPPSPLPGCLVGDGPDTRCRQSAMCSPPWGCSTSTPSCYS